MQRSFVLSLCALLAACAGGDPSALRARPPVVYIQSSHAVWPVARCLADRLGGRLQARGNGAQELQFGGDWLLSVMPGATGTVVAARRGRGGESRESEVRYAIARCAV